MENIALKERISLAIKDTLRQMSEDSLLEGVSEIVDEPVFTLDQARAYATDNPNVLAWLEA